jgi:thiamine-phosphate pyrophosphorylase
VTTIFDIPASCLITKGDATPDTFSEKKTELIATISNAVSASVSIVQIREKRLTSKQVFEIASDAVEVVRGSRTLIVINERLDIALAAKAHGVHLTSSSLATSDVRSVTPHGFIIGVSTHSRNEVLRAREDGADYAVFGPVFSSPGKSAAVGLDELRRVCEIAAPFPVLALGGIDATNAQSVIDAGSAGVAAIRFMNSSSGLEFARGTTNADK